MQIFGADERSVDRLSSSVLYSGTFTWEKSDGTTQKISIPGDYDVPAGETMVITTILPEDFDAGTVAIRSSLQDVNIYVDGSLRHAIPPEKHVWLEKIPPAAIFSARPHRQMPARSFALS